MIETSNVLIEGRVGGWPTSCVALNPATEVVSQLTLADLISREKWVRKWFEAHPAKPQ